MTTRSVFSAFEEGPDLWQRLLWEKRDILLYGMGNGADKILAVLHEKHIPIAGVFASDGFVRGQSFHGMPVRTFSDVCAKYPPMGCVILLAFGSARPEVLALLDRVAERYPLFVPDVPVCGEALFDLAFFRAHHGELLAARELLADAKSRRIFDFVTEAKLTGSYTRLCEAVSPDDTAELLSLPLVHCAADFGAYTGDSAAALQKAAPLSYLLCVEPDPRSFRKLAKWAAGVTDFEVDCRCAAVLDRIGYAPFAASGNRGAGLLSVMPGTPVGPGEIPIFPPDSLLEGRNVEYLKYDVEGAEQAALIGTKNTIARCRPRLKVACYHRSEDLYALPLLLREIAPRYRLYLRRTAGVPAWDIDLIALPEELPPGICEHSV